MKSWVSPAVVLRQAPAAPGQGASNRTTCRHMEMGEGTSVPEGISGRKILVSKPFEFLIIFLDMKKDRYINSNLINITEMQGIYPDD